MSGSTPGPDKGLLIHGVSAATDSAGDGADARRFRPPKPPVSRFFARVPTNPCMSITDTIKDLVGVGDDGVDVTEYECAECGHTFDSAKPPDRAQCVECLSDDVAAKSPSA